jgi:predicted dehydrogenase
VAGFVRAIAGEIEEPFGFRVGLRIQTLVETIARSSTEGRWLEVTLERTV